MKPTYEQLEQQLAAAGKTIEKLAAENVGLKAGIAEAYDEMEQLDGGHFSTDADGQPLDTLIPLVNAQDAIQRLAIDIKTPATDAALANFMAQGVERLADFCTTANNGHEINPDVEEIRGFAKQLRAEATR